MLELRLKNLSKYGKCTGEYRSIPIENMTLDQETKDYLEICAPSKSIITVHQYGVDISKGVYKDTNKTYQQTIYDQLTLKVWTRGTGPQNWKITQQTLDKEGIHYTYQTRGDT